MHAADMPGLSFLKLKEMKELTRQLKTLKEKQTAKALAQGSDGNTPVAQTVARRIQVPDENIIVSVNEAVSQMPSDTASDTASDAASDSSTGASKGDSSTGKGAPP